MKYSLLLLLLFAMAVAMPLDSERLLVLGQTAQSSIFYTLNGTWASNQTQVSVERNQTHLTIRMRAYFPAGIQRVCKGHAKEPLSLFSGEHTEVLLIPNSDQSVYFHFALTPARLAYHAIRRDASWQAEGVTFDVQLHDDCWDSIYCIPFSALGVPHPKEGDLWRVNFYRLDHGQGQPMLWSAWNHSESYHDISTAGTLLFSNTVPNPLPIPVRAVKTDKNSVTVTCAGTPNVKLALTEDGIPWKTKQTGSHYIFTRQQPPPFRRLKSDAFVTLTATRENQTSSVAATLAPLATDILIPDSFYYTQGPIICSIKEYPGTLFLRNTSGQILRQTAVTHDKTSLSIQGLPPGNYILEFDNGRFRTTRTIVLVEGWKPLRLPSGSLTCDTHHLYRGGHPIYLFGLAEESRKTFPVSPEFTFGIDTALASNAVRLSFIPGGRIIRKVHLSHLMYPMQRQRERYNEFFRELTLNPEGFYRMEYEAGLPLYFGESTDCMLHFENAPAWYQEVRQIAKKYQPNLLFSIHLDSQSQLKEYAKAADILEFSDWTASFAADDMMHHLEGAIFRLRQTIPDKPILFWMGGSVPDGQRHTPEELRAGVYLSILAGFSGNVIHTGHGNIPQERTRMWSFLCGITREIYSFYPEFVAGQEYHYPIPDIFTGKARKLQDGTIMLVVVNRRDGPSCLVTPAGTRIFTPYEPAVIRWK